MEYYVAERKKELSLRQMDGSEISQVVKDNTI